MNRLAPIRAAVLVALATLAGGACADAGDTLNLRLDYQVTHDANLFRLPKELPPSSEVAQVLSAGLALDKALGRQNIHAKVTTSTYRYQEHPSLNFDTVNLQGEWRWRVGNDWSGSLAYGQTETPGSYEELQSQQLRAYKIKQRSRSFRADYRLGPVTTLWAGSSAYERESSLVASDRVDNRVREFGVRFDSEAGSNIGFSYRSSDIDFPVRQTVGATSVDNGYSDNELRASARWMYSGQTSFEGWAGLFERKHSEVTERDVSGIQGRIAANWAATGQILLSAELWNTLSPIEQLTANFTRNRGAGLSATWALSSKVSARGKVSREEREYLGDPGYVLNSGPRRKDTLRTPEIALDYRPWRDGGIALSYQAPERRSNLPFTGFEDNVFTVSAYAQF